MSRKIGWACAAAMLALMGCADSSAKHEEATETGTLALPLTSTSPSGTTYRLRNATFLVQQPWYYCNTYGYAGGPSVGGASDNCPPIYVSSESDLAASSITVDLEEGTYEVRLLPDWYMERTENGVAVPSEAQLLNSSSQWIYVSRRSTSWVNFEFGIGGRSIWFNGKVNIGVTVYDNPEQLNGVAGAAGFPAWPAAGASY